ncbi:hypothetical protein [Rhizobacter fulvus]
MADYIRGVAVDAGITVMRERFATYERAWEKLSLHAQNLEMRNYIRAVTFKPIYVELRQRMGRLVARNIGSVVVDFVPGFGQAAVLVLTVKDVWDACQSMRDVDHMLKAEGEAVEALPAFCPAG